MTGKTVALTSRDRRLLYEVGRCGVLNRRQVIELGLFRSKTRANERLRKLTQARLLTAIPRALPQLGREYVYVLGPQSSDRALRRRRIEGSPLLLSHDIGMVDIRLTIERHAHMTQWRTDRECKELVQGVQPDGYGEYMVGADTFCVFVEYDRGTESLVRLQRKAKSYCDLAFSGSFSRIFGRQFFRVLLVVEGFQRLRTVSAAVRVVTDRVFRLTTMSELQTSGLTAPIWRRPGSEQSESL